MKKHTSETENGGRDSMRILPRLRWKRQTERCDRPAAVLARTRVFVFEGRQRTWIVGLLCVLILAGCATPPPVTEREAHQEYVELNDPLEPTNRAIFAFNRTLDQGLIAPLAQAYRDIVPLWVRQRIGDALDNLRAPVVFLNDILQGEPDRAMTTLSRFMLNTSLGFAGLNDFAGDVGIEGHDEDFGQTLAVWGMEAGPYIVLPIFGPSNPRDTVGMVVDWLVDPFNSWAENTDRDGLVYARAGVSAIHARSELPKVTRDLEKTSLDLYAAYRSLYRQRRADQIGNGNKSPDGMTSTDLDFPGLASDSADQMSSRP